MAFAPTPPSRIEAGQCLKLPRLLRDDAQAAQDDALDSRARVAQLPDHAPARGAKKPARRWNAARPRAGCTSSCSPGSTLRPDHIMVLARKRERLGLMQAELAALHIAAQQPEKTELIDCAEVQDVVALLDVLVSPRHDLSLARALKSPLFSINDQDLVRAGAWPCARPRRNPKAKRPRVGTPVLQTTPSCQPH